MNKLRLITLGIALASVTLAIAQQTEVVRERTPAPPPAPEPPDVDVLIERDVNATLSEKRAHLAVAADRVAEAKAQAAVQRSMMLAQAGGGGGGNSGMSGRDFEFAFGTPQRSSRALVIPKEATDAKSLGEVEEDLGVMAHILDKAVSSGDKAARAMGIAVFVKISGAAAPRNLYIEGHGAIFLLNVNYPLLSPPAKEDKAEAKEPVNNEWEEARREMARPGKSQTGGDPFELFEERFGADAAWNVKLPSAEYDADKVEDLKKDIISALKNAANIRRLKSDETVTVVVTGAEAGVITKAFKSPGPKPVASRSERAVVTKVLPGERTQVSDSAKLIIRARKADAEAYQNGKLDFDAFRKKVTTMIY